MPSTAQVRASHAFEKGRPVVRIQDIWDTAAGDGPAQQVLARAGVLVREEPAVDQQPGMVIDDEEQPGPHRTVPSRPGHPRAARTSVIHRSFGRAAS